MMGGFSTCRMNVVIGGCSLCRRNLVRGGGGVGEMP